MRALRARAPLPCGARLSLIALSALCCTLLWACDDEEASRCQQDSDCREGYRCDQTLYVGECVQQQEVISCGEGFCFYPQERCLEERCVPAGGSSGAGGVPLGGLTQAGTTAGAQAGERPLGGVLQGGLNAGAQGAVEAGIAVTAGGEAGVEPQAELSVTWLSPEERALLPLEPTSYVTGLVTYNGEPVTAAQSVSVSISWLSALEGPSSAEPISVSVADGGRFEAELSLPRGAITLVAELSAFGLNAQAYRQLTRDDFVRPQGGSLQWGGQPYRALGVDLPRLLPWLSELPTSGRAEALQALWSELRGLKVRYLRTFVGWTRGAWATLSGPQAFQAEGIELLDELVESATVGGVKLIFVLADPAGAHVGLADYVRWSGVMNPMPEDEARVYRVGQTREALLNAMSLFPARQNQRSGRFYRDEPAILGWELLNAPRWLDLSAEDQGQVTGFLTEASELMREAAPQQLLWTGEIGFDRNPSPYGPAAQQLASLSAGGLLTGLFGGWWVEHRQSLSATMSGVALDVRASGVPSSAQWSAFGSAWLRGHALAGLSAGHPLSVSYARLVRRGVGASAQLAVLNAWSAEALSQGYALFTVSELALPEEARSGDELWELGAPDTRELLESLGERWGLD